MYLNVTLYEKDDKTLRHNHGRIMAKYFSPRPSRMRQA